MLKFWFYLIVNIIILVETVWIIRFLYFKASASLNDSHQETDSPTNVALLAPNTRHQIVAPVATKTANAMHEKVELAVHHSHENSKSRQIRPIPVQMVHNQGSILSETQAKNSSRQTRVKPPPQ